jgi:serine/threonine protein kinase
MVGEQAPSNTPWQFTLLAPIAVGATTRVDLARVTTGEFVGSLVAVKRLLPEAQLDSSTQTRFLDELATTAAIRHPNVVRVLAIGRDTDGPFLAVELVLQPEGQHGIIRRHIHL